MNSRLMRRKYLPFLLLSFMAFLWPQTAFATPTAFTCDSGHPFGAAAAYTEFIQTNGQRGSESEGAVAYGGNLDGNGMTVGTRLTNTPTTFPALVINGETTGNYNLQKGSAYVRDTRANINFNGGGSRLANAPIDFTSAFADLRARADTWAATAANGTAAVVDSQTTGTALGGNVLLLQGTNPTLNIFEVPPSQLLGIRATFIDVPAGSTALINVSGSIVRVEGEVRYKSGSTYRQPDDTPVADAVKRTVWNFSQATDVSLYSGSAFGGHVFAPRAHVFAAQVGHNNGAVVAKSFASNYETHLYPFPDGGCLPAPQPPEDPEEPEVPQPPVVHPAQLHISKTASKAVIAPNETVSFTVSVKNHGQGSAAGVVIEDVVPVGLTVVSAPGCSISGQTVQCVVGVLASGATASFTITTTAQALTSTVSTTDQITVTKIEQHLSLPANTTQTANVVCSGGIATDASFRVDAVDLGTGDFEDVELLRLHTTDVRSYQAVVANHASGQAQGKLFAACLNETSNEGRQLIVSAPVVHSAQLNAGRHSVTLECGVGRTPIAPSLDVFSGRAKMVANVPITPTSRRIEFEADNNTQVELGVRCLSNTTSELHGSIGLLEMRTISVPVQLAAHENRDIELSCGDQEKGIVAGWELNPDITVIGHEPRPKTRVFWLRNPTSSTLNGTLYLLCVNVHLAGNVAASLDVVNTASVSTTSTQTNQTVLTASAPVRIQNTVIQNSIAQHKTPDNVLSPKSTVPGTKTPEVKTVVVKKASLRVAVNVASAKTYTVSIRTVGKLKVGKKTYKKNKTLVKRKLTLKAGSQTVSLKTSKTLNKALSKKKVVVVIKDGKNTYKFTTKLK